MSGPHDHRFREPTDATGDWCVVRSVLFEHEHAPTAAKFFVEKLTVQLLHREPLAAEAPVLRYAGASSAGGHPSTVRLELRAASPDRYLYRLTNERTAPRCWEDEAAFVKECDRRFDQWCARLWTVGDAAAWRPAQRVPLADIVARTVAAEDALAATPEDPVPVAAVRQQVLAALRAGMGFFTAGKEGGSHLFFDGQVFRRNDYGDEPHLSESHADDAGMAACLRRFYDWDAQRDSCPHKKTELEVWTYILGQLKPRR